MKAAILEAKGSDSPFYRIFDFEGDPRKMEKGVKVRGLKKVIKMRSERRRIWNGFIFVVLLTLLVFVTVGCVSAATTIYVNPNESIQSAVTAANPFDTIIVRDGTYTGNVDVNVDNLTVKSENGSTNCIVQAFDPNNHVFEVTANWVTISGFTVKNATGYASSHKAGIFPTCLENLNIFGNKATNNRYGIYLLHSNNNIIENNTANLNNGEGIYLISSNSNTLTNNTANSNTYFGIYLCIHRATIRSPTLPRRTTTITASTSLIRAITLNEQHNLRKSL